MLARAGIGEAALRRAVAASGRYRHALHHSRRVDPCTAVNLFHEIARHPRFRLRRWWRALAGGAAE